MLKCKPMITVKTHDGCKLISLGEYNFYDDCLTALKNYASNLSPDDTCWAAIVTNAGIIELDLKMIFEKPVPFKLCWTSRMCLNAAVRARGDHATWQSYLQEEA